MSIFHKLGARLDDQQREGAESHPRMGDPLDDLFAHYKERLVRETNLDHLIKLPAYQKRRTIERLISEMMGEEKIVLSHHDRSKLLEMILNDSVGFGPLEPLLRDEEVTEIMVNGASEVYYEKNGRVSLSAIRFKNDEHVRHIIERIVAPIGRRIDESSPLVDARLDDGSRVNAAIPPISMSGPVLTIRKFQKDPYTMKDLISFGSLSEQMALFLETAAASKLNIIISGGTGSGKTTLLNVVSAAIPPGERIITIEDMAELRLNRKNVVSLEARPANMEGTGEITIRQLVKNSLRMRPDRIVVGEVRGGEAFDMLQAMNTGHEGSLTTIHANSPQDAITRLEAMIVMSNPGITVEVVKPYIAAAVDLVVQTLRLADGSRKVVSIAEAVNEGSGLSLREIFRFNRQGIKADGTVLGYFESSGYVPNCHSRFVTFGHTYPIESFQAGGSR
ncbi:CpaF family protein [Brevibacillus humidisoli]|uniref:CpaF family protein n=1 Tax=Brevibacillus humidisoli TaxID=2895522 RepID=UPI001E462918|nr:CpaF family protein [Brevibacillus humidisoli]UFJ40796.1 CpaF family protein [Brevibacillus humidisoli]